MWYWRWPSSSKAIQWSGRSESSIGAARKGTGFFWALRASKDPAVLSVVLEDIAAVAGLLIALCGIMAADLGGYDSADGIASILIGLLLAVVAGFLAREIKSLLVGEAASPALRKGICEILASETRPGKPIRKINDVLTMHLGPREVLVTPSVPPRRSKQ
jgi:divalent metal cation (Fe/Co/Zn/Cd) transporter